MNEWIDVLMAVGLLVLIVGMVALVLCGAAVAWWGARNRRIAWERYVQEREAKGGRSVSDRGYLHSPPPPPPPAPGLKLPPGEYTLHHNWVNGEPMGEPEKIVVPPPNKGTR